MIQNCRLALHPRPGESLRQQQPGLGAGQCPRRSLVRPEAGRGAGPEGGRAESAQRGHLEHAGRGRVPRRGLEDRGRVLPEIEPDQRRHGHRLLLPRHDLLAPGEAGGGARSGSTRPSHWIERTQVGGPRGCAGSTSRPRPCWACPVPSPQPGTGRAPEGRGKDRDRPARKTPNPVDRRTHARTTGTGKRSAGGMGCHPVRSEGRSRPKDAAIRRPARPSPVAPTPMLTASDAPAGPGRLAPTAVVSCAVSAASGRRPLPAGQRMGRNEKTSRRRSSSSL